MDASMTLKRTRRSRVLTVPAALLFAAGLILAPASLCAQGVGGRAEDPKEDPSARFKLRTLQISGKKGVKYDPNQLVKARQKMKAMSISPQAWPPKNAQAATGQLAGIAPANWQELGPGNIGGRICSILTHPTNPDLLYVGSVSGGIWRSTNRGVTWAPLNDFMANLCIGSLVMDRTNSNVIYAGTGELYSGDGLPGAGVFKSTDGGTNWTQLAATASWQAVNRLVQSPTSANTLLAATTIGIFRTTDGGTTWSLTFGSDTRDIEFHPTNGNLAVSSGYGNAFYSVDGGVNWTLAGANFLGGRTELSYAKSNPNIVYASVDVNSGELWVSSDGGKNYTLRNTGNFLLSSQGWYDNALFVDPTNSNNLIVGGVGIYRSLDAGVTFESIWTNIHADQHIVVPAQGFPSPRSVYVGDDGGIFRMDDFVTGTSWVNLNNSLGITQFYGGAGNPTKNFYMGGTQDNGTPRYNGNLNGWADAICCDGGWTSADPVLAADGSSFWYGETQNWSHYRIRLDAAGNVAQSDFISGGAPETRFLFIPPAVLDPNGSTRLYKGGGRLWRLSNPRTADPNASWTLVKQAVPESTTISAITVAQGNSDIVWVGYDDGQIWSTSNGTAATPTWTRRGLGTLPGRYCHRVTVDPTTTSRIYATFGGFASVVPDNVWKSEDGGASWSNIGNNLPDVPVRTLVVNPGNSNFIYAGSEVGVFASENRGATWSPSVDGPNNGSVDELFWSGSYLVAATHGRGMHRILVNGAPTVTLTAPPNNSTFPAGSTLNLTATASDPGGSVTKVEFFQGSTKLGEDLTSPYTFDWVNVPAGNYVLTAKATDNSNNTATSAPVNITVTSGQVTIRNPLADAHVRNGIYANNNFGTATTLESKTGPVDFSRDAYLKFNVDGLSGTVSSAKLRLFGKLTDPGTVTVVAFAVSNTTWIESGTGGITWNTKPALGASQATLAVSGTTAAWWEFDVTNYIKSEIAAGRTTVTLALRYSASANPLFQINSREQAASKPELSLSLAAQPTALFVVGNPTLVAGDVAIRNRLQAMGFAVTTIDDDLAGTADANGKSVVFISSTVISTTVNTKFRFTATPVVNCEEKIQDDLGMTGTVSGTDFGTTANQTQVQMANAGHPLAGGLAGVQTITSAANAVNWGMPGANAAGIATQIGNASHFTDYGFEKNAAMPGLAAPGRRVNLFLTDATASSLTTSGWTLFEAAVRWAAGL